ncbi:hypothetical protein RHMOL_Rhmol08G0286700 [Rhododendron molle]|uniref:Uncharacterized protein n=1 Tax=Rhododendron molle TaxID=49168 RepID=A0ACC0MTH5_RHOML|nr:hypothetical protein RHMOL_Rhmol08G0286700 [Rhododendron molle]
MEMKRVSVEPDDITFIGVLNGCGHAGLMGSCGPNARGLKQPGRPSGAVAIYRMVIMRPPRGVRGRGRARGRGVHEDKSEAAEVMRPLPQVRTRGGRGRGRGLGEAEAEVHREEEANDFVEDIPFAEVMRSLPRIKTRGGRGRGRARGKAKVPCQEEQDAIVEDIPMEVALGRRRRRGRGRGRAEAQHDAHLDVGGPEDLSLLKSFRTHVAKAILEGEERGSLRLHQHSGLLRTWVVTEERFKEKVINSGLLPLCTINKNSHCNSFRISAFVERWHPETNTFHFHFGEMGITLDDVEHLLGIPVCGLAVYKVDERTPRQLLTDLLGLSEEAATNAIEVNAVKGYAVKLSWLETNFKDVNETDTEERVVCCARAYLLYVIGCTLFCDKSGGLVQLDLLPLLEDLDQVHTYGWGSSCLAYLYRNLGHASRRKTKQIGGFLILLEAWINEHFPTLHPVVDPEYTEDLPRARRWCLHSESGTSVQHYRRVLDDLLVDEVIFDPYKDRRQNFQEIAFYTGPIRAMSVVEPYLPDRVLRQFGLLQRIPADPIAPQRASRGQHTYDVDYEWTEGFWSSPDYHLVPEDKRERTPPGMPWACTDDYIPWLMVFSHPRVGRGQAPVGLRVRQGREEQVRVVLDVVHRALGDPELGAVELRQALQDVEAIFRPTFGT